ncbi:hypothetical protein ACFSUS_01965 [Spirosoma soli]|uniref:Glycosyltransferase RgtA/B/C/D-like domain-containing protein n=1 Tax=Spirosoma soli TaxID=1770529 RepID=A0ABW5LXQ0_9BACT
MDIRLKSNRWFAQEWVGVVILASMYIIAKMPFLTYNGPINPDESQMLTQAITLKHDPVFWRSVDGTTSGPINSYLIWLLDQIGLSFSYVHLHWLSTTLILLGVWITYRTLLLLVNARTALVAIAITYSFFLFSNHKDFNHYNSELASVVLLAVASYILARIRTLAEAPLYLYWTLGAVCFLVPLAKLQGGPVALLYLLYAGVELFSSSLTAARRRLALVVLAGGAVTMLSVLLTFLATHALLHDSYVMYIQTNLVHYNAGNSLYMVMKLVFGSSYDYLLFLLFSGLLWAFFGLSRTTNQYRKLLRSRFWWFLWANLIVSFWVVARTGYVFEHYLFYTITPITLLNGYILQQLFFQRDTYSPFRVSYQTIAVILLIGQLATYWLKLDRQNQHFSPASVPFHERIVTSLINYYAKPTDCLAVWGWNCRYYTTSGLRQATRENHSIRCMKTNSLGALHNLALVDWYRRQYVNDIKRNRPSVFIDEVRANSLFNHPNQVAHETIPALQTFIEANYQLVSYKEGILVYVRNDRFMAKHTHSS